MTTNIFNLIPAGCFLAVLIAGQAFLVACQDQSGSANSDAAASTAAASGQGGIGLVAIITTFVGDVIASAPDEDGAGPAAESALSRLPRSLQSRLRDGEDSSLHAGLLEFLQADTVPDGLLLVQILQDDPLTKQARAQITLAFGDREELRIVELERTVCIARSRNQGGSDVCKAGNLAIYGDEEPWKITNVKLP